jgi:hypothetical protein
MAADDNTDERTPLIPKQIDTTNPTQAASSDNKTNNNNTTAEPSNTATRHADTNASWPEVAALPPRSVNDENLQIFRRAIGINYDLPSNSASTMEEGRKSAIGIYRAVIREKRAKALLFWTLNLLVYFCHFAQIIVAASLTAMGPTSSKHAVAITVLGASNTVIAGVLALLNGQGLPDRLRKDEIEFRKIQDWIEETEALLAVGIIGRDRTEVGLLVETAFKKYNAVQASEENNKPSSYVRQPEEGARNDGAGGDAADDASSSSGNAVVRLNVPGLR